MKVLGKETSEKGASLNLPPPILYVNKAAVQAM